MNYHRLIPDISKVKSGGGSCGTNTGGGSTGGGVGGSYILFSLPRPGPPPPKLHDAPVPVHPCISFRSAGQEDPPFWGCCNMVLERVWNPAPHSTEQGLQLLQLLTEQPIMGGGGRGGGVTIGAIEIPEDTGEGPGERTGEGTGEGPGERTGEGPGERTGEGVGEGPGEGVEPFTSGLFAT